MQVRPKILLTDGRIQQPIQIPNGDAVLSVSQTFLQQDTEAAVSSLTVQNATGFNVSTTAPYVLIDEFGNGSSEIVALTSVTAPFTLALSAATAYPHSANSNVYALVYNKVEISYATTVSGSKVVIDTIDLSPDQVNTLFTNTVAAGYYYARFYSTILNSFSPYSDPAPVDGYTQYSARSIIDSALGEINKVTSETLSDQFAFQQLDAFQTDMLRELKRWSFMQEFEYIMGQFNVGEWKIPLPDNIDDANTNKSIYNVRVGTNGRLTWIDKAKWDDFIFNLAYTTLSVNLIAGATTMTLVNSGDFNHLTDSNTDGSGTVIIGGNSYDYSANNTTTGVLTLSTVITSSNTATAGQDVFQNVKQGLPTYYTIFDSTLWYWPITSNEYDGFNAFLDYYTKQIRIQHDSDEIVVPDSLAASLYLQWKFLKKLNNGDEDEGSIAVMKQYLARREKLKNKDVKNRTFKVHPRFQNFAIQEQWSSGDPRYIRDGNFGNTGF